MKTISTPKATVSGQRIERQMAQIHGGSYEKRLDFDTVALRDVGNNLECSVASMASGGTEMLRSGRCKTVKRS